MIPFPCDSCIHFSGMGFIPYCKKKVIAHVNDKPVYEWCSIMRTMEGDCGIDSKLYEKNDNVIRIRPTIVYSGRNHCDKINKTTTSENDAKVDVNKINKPNRDNAKQTVQKETIKANQTNIATITSLESKSTRKSTRTKQSTLSKQSMEQLATVLAATSK